MSPDRPALRCFGCGAAPAPDDPLPFRCPNAGAGDVDHVLRRAVPPAALYDAGQPFLRYRERLYSWRRAIAGGLGDAVFVNLVKDLDEAVAAVDGQGFQATPVRALPDLACRLGVAHFEAKDETGNVAGSHKARHLFGVSLHLRVADRRGLLKARPRLAIASCGNAAAAAAVVAAALGYPLEVFIPPSADPGVVDRLRALQAEISVCPRRAQETGDPCYLRFREALARGSVPFCCQGPDNGLTIEGGMTLAWEWIDHWQAHEGPPDHLVVQVGGGALASALVQGLSAVLEAQEMPRIHTVQTESAWPLRRAHVRLSERTTGPLAGRLLQAAKHRSSFMWPWETTPQSIAGGILDDETYDWLAVAEGMLRTGGRALVVGEPRLREAAELARQAGLDASPTGSAGLAGALALAEGGHLRPADRIAVVLSG